MTALPPRPGFDPAELFQPCPTAAADRDRARRIAELLYQIERVAAELDALGGSIRFSLNFSFTVENGSESTRYFTSDLVDALHEARADSDALRGLSRPVKQTATPENEVPQ